MNMLILFVFKFKLFYFYWRESNNKEEKVGDFLFLAIMLFGTEFLRLVDIFSKIRSFWAIVIGKTRIIFLDSVARSLAGDLITILIFMLDVEFVICSLQST